MIKTHQEIEQGTPEWHALRCGLLTASEMKLIITPTLKIASNDKERAHLYELTAQRITGYVEPQYISDDMLRGMDDEFSAKQIYNEHHAKTYDVGFITRTFDSFTLGYSPDALVDMDGTIEIKSRRQKYQIETIIKDEMPDDYMIQVQTGLLVSGRDWCDFISYSAGLPMYVKRVHADAAVQGKILEAATAFHEKLADNIARYENNSKGLIKTERKKEEEITV